jgi:RimJ/RimL family protein N-acetyltransferase
MIIGEKDTWGKGYGVETGRLLLNHVFTKLKLHRISVGVVGFNDRAIRYWENLGFKKEGIERDAYYCDGKYDDFIMMGILENEFNRSNTA